jgi:hypothetical protein
MWEIQEVPQTIAWHEKYRFQIVHRLCIVVPQNVPIDLDCESGVAMPQLSLSDFYSVVWRSMEARVCRNA